MRDPRGELCSRAVGFKREKPEVFNSNSHGNVHGTRPGTKGPTLKGLNKTVGEFDLRTRNKEC
jgi:hypothetical protein